MMDTCHVPELIADGTGSATALPPSLCYYTIIFSFVGFAVPSCFHFDLLPVGPFVSFEYASGALRFH
ncbi:hypothetical protein Tco_0458301 [Tanacetum coccineum]